MPIPIEVAALPHDVKQALLDLDFFLFPPPLDVLKEICLCLGIDAAEAELFIQDNTNTASLTVPPYVVEVNANIELSSLDGIIDLVGPPCSGKTHLCHSAVKAMVDFPVVYIDSDGSFSSHLLARLGMVSLSSIWVYRVFTWHELVSAIHRADIHEPRLMVIDSIAGPLRHAFGSTDDAHAQRYRVIKSVCALLRRFQKRHNAIVVAVNQMTSKIDEARDSSQLVPSLGETYAKALRAGGLVRTIHLTIYMHLFHSYRTCAI